MSFRIGDEVVLRIYPYRNDPRTWHGTVVELPDTEDEDYDEDDDRHYGIVYICPISNIEHITYRTDASIKLKSLDLDELLTI